MAPKAGTTIELHPVQVKRMTVQIHGLSSLICHRFSERAREKIEDKQQGKAPQAREQRDPEQDWQDSLYPVPGQDGVFGFPASGFKGAIVDTCSFLDGITKVFVRGALYVIGDVLPVNGIINKRTDIVRVGQGKADVRYRCEFVDGWTVELPIRYDAQIITPEQIVNLIQSAGFHVGVGDWRAQKDGNHGQFEVVGGQDA